MKKVRIDITGNKYGRLTVLKYAFTKNKTAFWECECECGNIKSVRGSHLKNGAIKSCGCLKRETTKKMATVHSFHGTRLYNLWKNMHNRCYTKSSHRYKNYGERGITVIGDWHEFKPFYDWAMSNGYEEGLTIERIDVDGNYSPNNCEWIPHSEQAYNKQNTIRVEIHGTTKLLIEWADKYKLKRSTIYHRYYRGDRGTNLIRPTKRA